MTNTNQALPAARPAPDTRANINWHFDNDRFGRAHAADLISRAIDAQARARTMHDPAALATATAALDDAKDAYTAASLRAAGA